MDTKYAKELNISLNPLIMNRWSYREIEEGCHREQFVLP